MSFRRTIAAPPLAARMMMFSNSAGSVEPARGRDRERLFNGRAGRRLPEAADSELLVLVGDGFLHVARRDAQLRHAIGLQPDPHRVVGRAEDGRLIGARNALQRIEHVNVRVVGDVGRVVAVARRIDRDHHHERRRLLLHLDALRLHRLTAIAATPGSHGSAHRPARVPGWCRSGSTR